MPHTHPRRAPRRVVLESVPRREAAQRLSLAFTLLARDLPEMPRPSAPVGVTDGVAAPPAAWIDGEGLR
jgi:hypothetical protein